MRNKTVLAALTTALIATPATADVTARPLTLPITFENNQLFVDVGINGGAPARFILDSGASGCVVDATVARDLGVEVHGETKGTGAGAGSYTIRFVDNVSYAIGPERLTVPRSYVIDLSGQRTLLGYPVAGILGYEFFLRYVAHVDFDARKMTLIDPVSYTPPPGSDVVPFTLVQKTPHIKARLVIDGTAPLVHEYLVDSGSGDAITDEAIAGAKERVEIVSGVGLGQEFRSTLGRAHAFELGATKLDRPYVGAGGRSLIGNEILRRFAVTFDYPHQRLVLVPNSHVVEPFEFDASGLDLRWTDDLANFVAHDVAQASPATDAGLRHGDIIVAIDGRQAKSYAIAAAVALLRRAGTRVRLTILRDGKPQEIELLLRKRI